MQIPLATGTVDLDHARFERRDGTTVSLSRREATLLAYLADRAGEDVPRTDLLTEVWGHHELSLSRAVDTAVARLRRKIESDPSTPEVLCTSHGEGYRLVLDVPRAAVAPALDTRAPLLDLGDRVVDLAAGLVRGDGEPTLLTAQERKLLEALAHRPGVIVDPGRLARMAGVTGGRAALCNTVYRLRSKIEVDPRDPSFLVGIRGQGYRLDIDTRPSRPLLGSLVETMWAVAEHAGRLLQLDDCVVYARDGGYLVQVAAYGQKALQRGDIASPITLRIGEGIVGSAARTAMPQCIADVRSDPRYVPDLSPGRSELAVPILRDGDVVGVLDSESSRVAAYQDTHRSTFQSLADIAAAAARDLSLAMAA